MKLATWTSGWALPLTIGVALHLGLGLVPVEFSGGPGTTPKSIQIALVNPMPEPPAPEPLVPEQPALEETVAETVATSPKARPRRARPAEVAQEPTRENTAIAAAEAAEPAPAEALAELAERPVEEAQAPEPARQMASIEPVEEIDMRGYGMGVFSAVNAEQQYPRAATRFRLEGTAMVRIRINRDGTLAERPQIVTSTNHELLDREVLRMVEVAAPFQRLPAGFNEQVAEFVVPIRFRLARSSYTPPS
ncbi:MAG: energy transducer TonB [Bradymonadaceae bacterium]|nr:energy transducer TonB [Lujinxingiaceae bacterium]